MISSAIFGLTTAVVLIDWKYGMFYFLLAAFAAFITDSGAYFVGSAVGKTKLAPVVSPKKTVEGAKNITIEVVMADETSTVYEVNTDGECLIDAMNEADGLTYEGEEGMYGLSISSINGVRADYTLDGAYWAFYEGEEYCNYGVSEQPIEDGDSFSIVYTVAA